MGDAALVRLQTLAVFLPTRSVLEEEVNVLRRPAQILPRLRDHTFRETRDGVFVSLLEEFPVEFGEQPVGVSHPGEMRRSAEEFPFVRAGRHALTLPALTRLGPGGQVKNRHTVHRLVAHCPEPDVAIGHRSIDIPAQRVTAEPEAQREARALLTTPERRGDLVCRHVGILLEPAVLRRHPGSDCRRGSAFARFGGTGWRAPVVMGPIFRLDRQALKAELRTSSIVFSQPLPGSARTPHC